MECVSTMLLFLLKILKQVFARPILQASFFGFFCSCSEKAEIKSYSIPSEYDGPIVSWILPSEWGENPDLSGPMAGSFHVKTKSGPIGRIGVMPFRQQVSTLDVANMFGRELGFPLFNEETLSPFVEKKKIGNRTFEWLSLEEKNSLSLTNPKVALLALLRQEGETWLFPFIADQQLVAQESANFENFLETCILRPGKERQIVAKSSRPAPAVRKPAPPLSKKNPWKWEVPESWNEGKVSSVRLASFSVSGDSGEALDISVTSFPGDVGGLLANVNRWLGQIGLSPVGQENLKKYCSSLSFAGHSGHMVEAYGKEQGLFAGVLFLEDESWFFKLQGDRKLAEREKANFSQFLQSITSLQYP